MTMAQPRSLLSALDHPADIGFRQIVVGYDGSRSAMHALAWAGFLAGHGTSISIVHARDPRDPRVPELDVDVVGTAERAAERLRGSGVSCRCLTIAGDPAEELRRAARLTHADLVVVGNSGHPRVRRATLGSVAGSLLTRTSEALLVARGVPPPGHVVIASDGSEESSRGLRLGVRIAIAAQVQGTILHVHRPPHLPRDLPVHATPIELADVTPEERSRFDLIVESGEPAAVIARIASERGAGLIVAGRTGAGRRADSLAGGTAAKLAHEAPTTVLLVRKERGPS